MSPGSGVRLTSAAVIAGTHKLTPITDRAGESIFCIPGGPYWSLISAATFGRREHGVFRSENAFEYYFIFFRDELLQVMACVDFCVQGIVRAGEST